MTREKDRSGLISGFEQLHIVAETDKKHTHLQNWAGEEPLSGYSKTKLLLLLLKKESQTQNRLNSKQDHKNKNVNAFLKTKSPDQNRNKKPT